MLDINLGNKTLFVGVLIALILSYGMVNFDTGRGADVADVSAVSAAVQAASHPADYPVAAAVTSPASTGSAAESSAIPSASAAHREAEASAIPSASAAHRETKASAIPSASAAHREAEASPQSRISHGRPDFDTIEERRDYYDSRS